MGKIMLLTAAPATGKTTAIKKIINLLGIQNCGGFYTEEVKNSNGQRTGFVCITLSGIKSRLADIDFESEVRVGRYGVDLKGFDEIAINAIEEALKAKQILIIDEIGPMELYSEKFKEAINKVMDSEKIIVGTIFFSQHPEVDKIKKNEHIELFELTKENRDFIPNEIVERVKAAIGNLK